MMRLSMIDLLLLDSGESSPFTQKMIYGQFFYSHWCNKLIKWNLRTELCLCTAFRYSVMDLWQIEKIPILVQVKSLCGSYTSTLRFS